MLHGSKSGSETLGLLLSFGRFKRPSSSPPARMMPHQGGEGHATSILQKWRPRSGEGHGEFRLEPLQPGHGPHLVLGEV